VRRFSEPGRGVEKELESPPYRELAHRANDVSVGGNSEMISPPGSVGRSEPILERHRQDSCRKAGCRMLEIDFEARVGAQGRGQASIKITMVRVASDVTGVAERANQRGVPMDPSGDTQEVVVREVADDDVAFAGQPGDQPEIRSEMRRPSFLHKAGHGPRARIETPLEVATADEEQACVDPCSVEGTTVELGHCTRTGPLVRENDHAHPHRQSIAD
jgi:hypothetical protein